MSKKIKDLAVRVSTYKDKNGQDKGKYQNVGCILQMDDGKKTMLLNRWFNPAGIPFAPGRENSDVVLISMFDIKKDGESGDEATPAAPCGGKDLDDDIPF